MNKTKLAFYLYIVFSAIIGIFSWVISISFVSVFHKIIFATIYLAFGTYIYCILKKNNATEIDRVLIFVTAVLSLQNELIFSILSLMLLCLIKRIFLRVLYSALVIIYIGIFAFVSLFPIATYKEVPSPNSNYTATLKYSNQGALGGSAWVECYKNIGVLKISKVVTHISNTELISFTILWIDDTTVSINDIPYEIGMLHSPLQ